MLPIGVQKLKGGENPKNNPKVDQITRLWG